jgi:hypothetical protein
MHKDGFPSRERSAPETKPEKAEKHAIVSQVRAKILHASDPSRDESRRRHRSIARDRE